MVSLSDIQQARTRINGVAVRTPLIPLEYEGITLYLKPENLQPIGAFKVRGAYNKIASLTDEERARGVITYSSGNH
ncbi:MAG: threonine dehydratase, partial [Acidobacteria bacterium]